jgi:hypothetical protein
MNGLDSAKTWFEGELARLRHVQDLSENHEEQELEKTLPDAISIWLTIYRVLETQSFPSSLLGQLNRIRDERNRLAHGGFHQDIAHTSPEDAYEVLRRALQLLAQSQSNGAL